VYLIKKEKWGGGSAFIVFLVWEMVDLDSGQISLEFLKAHLFLRYSQLP
jgi:hypothetical protein